MGLSLRRVASDTPPAAESSVEVGGEPPAEG
jgi:hypothetical protein